VDSPHRPEEANPLDELSPTLRTAVEGVRAQPAPSASQEKALRRLEETQQMSMPNRSVWSRPSLAIAALAASVAVAFGAGYWTHSALTPPAPPGERDLALNHRPVPQLPAVPGDPDVILIAPTTRDDYKDAAPESTKGGEKGKVERPNSESAPGTGPAPTPLPTINLPPANPTTPVSPYAQPGLPGPGGIPFGGATGSGGLGGGLGGFPGGPGGPAPGFLPPGSGVIPTTGTTTASPAFPVVPGRPPVDPGKVPAPGDGKEGKGESKPGEPKDSPAQGNMKKETERLTTELKSIISKQETVLAKLTDAEKTVVAREAAQAWGSLPAGERRGEALVKALEDGLKKAKDLPPAKQQEAIAALRVQIANQQAAEGLPGTENYNHFVDNPYQAVQKTPLSTFSVSVDTASYANVRRYLQQDGRLPPPDAVRIADMVNYFHYAYPQPKGDAPVAFAMNMTNCPWNTEHQLLRVAMAAKKYSADDMPNRNFTFLLDTSGSMSPENRLPLLIKSLKLLVEQLRPQDRVAIVTYAGSAGLVLESTPGNQKEKILAALDNLSAGGSTAGGAGIELAYKVAKDNFIDGGINRVILGTDGDFNVGVSSQGDLVRMIEEKRKTGVYLTILGYGYGNRKDGNLERMAHVGNGYYAYVDNLKEAQKIFVEQGGALVTVAKDVKLQLEFNPQRVAGYRLIGYENKLLRDEDFNNDAVDAGDMGSGHTVTALYEIIPAGKKVPNVETEDLKYQTPKTPAEAANSGEFLTVKLRYKDPAEEKSKKLEQPLAGAVEKLDATPEDMRFVIAVAEFGLLLRNSPYKGTANFGSVIEFAGQSLGKDEGGHRAEFVALAKKAKELHDAAQKQKDDLKKEQEAKEKEGEKKPEGDK